MSPGGGGGGRSLGGRVPGLRHPGVLVSFPARDVAGRFGGDVVGHGLLLRSPESGSPCRPSSVVRSAPVCDAAAERVRVRGPSGVRLLLWFDGTAPSGQGGWSRRARRTMTSGHGHRRSPQHRDGVLRRRRGLRGGPARATRPRRWRGWPSTWPWARDTGSSTSRRERASSPAGCSHRARPSSPWSPSRGCAAPCRARCPEPWWWPAWPRPSRSAPQTVDAVTVAQALHWFATERGRRRDASRPSSRVAPGGGVEPPRPADPLQAALHRLMAPLRGDTPRAPRASGAGSWKAGTVSRLASSPTRSCARRGASPSTSKGWRGAWPR